MNRREPPITCVTARAARTERRADIPPPHFVSRTYATVPSLAPHGLLGHLTVMAVDEGLSGLNSPCLLIPQFSIRPSDSICCRGKKGRISSTTLCIPGHAEEI